MAGTSYRRYLTIIGIPIFLLMVLCVSLSLWLEPLTNDLTRLGGYSENSYGWNGEQVQFSPVLVPFGTPDRSSEVVVIGDSFSVPETATSANSRTDGGFWTDFFAEQTGLQVAALHRSWLIPEDYIQSEAYRLNPPKLLIFELAERNLGLFAHYSGPCPTLAPGVLFNPDLHPIDQPHSTYRRNTASWIGSDRIDAAIDFLIKNGFRSILGINTTPVLRYPLSRAGLFTNQKSSNLLIYNRELAKLEFDEPADQRIRCYFRNFQSLAEANERTRFVLMIAPDRSTAYSDYLPASKLRNLTEMIARDRSLNVVRVDLALKQAIASGTQDVYYPNDTHWASAGKAIAARTLTGYIKSMAAQ
jgi:SGNH hydrolase-like domain, acetyltransferase AlgX